MQILRLTTNYSVNICISIFCIITKYTLRACWEFLSSSWKSKTSQLSWAAESYKYCISKSMPITQNQQSASTLMLIPGASWEQLPWRTRSRANEAVIDQFLKSNVPNWPAAPVCSAPDRLYLTKRRQSGHLSHRKVCSCAIHASCSSLNTFFESCANNKTLILIVIYMRKKESRTLFITVE